MNISEKNNITDVWNISPEEIMKIHNNLLHLENNLMAEHKGKYFDYQLIDKLFPDCSDKEKAQIFLYGRWVHESFYQENK